MPDTFNVDPGQTVGRELLVAYLNTGTTQSPTWSPVGRRVVDSSIEMDWSTESSVDIFGDTHVTGKKATRTQTFDPWTLAGGDVAQQRIWELGVKENNVTALLNQDMLIVHLYAGTTAFAERYAACSVLPTNLGGAGGGAMGMGVSVTYGGTRTTGTASVSSSGVVTFTADN